MQVKTATAACWTPVVRLGERTSSRRTGHGEQVGRDSWLVATCETPAVSWSLPPAMGELRVAAAADASRHIFVSDMLLISQVWTAGRADAVQCQLACFDSIDEHSPGGPADSASSHLSEASLVFKLGWASDVRGTQWSGSHQLPRFLFSSEGEGAVLHAVPLRRWSEGSRCGCDRVVFPVCLCSGCRVLTSSVAG